MGLAVKHIGGKNAPILLCDHCGEEIENWKAAMAFFEWPSEEEPNYSPVYIYHKVKCGQDLPLSEELSNYIPWLLCNHKWGKIRRGKEDSTITLTVPEPIEL